MKKDKYQIVSNFILEEKLITSYDKDWAHLSILAPYQIVEHYSTFEEIQKEFGNIFNVNTLPDTFKLPTYEVKCLYIEFNDVHKIISIENSYTIEEFYKIIKKTKKKNIYTSIQKVLKECKENI